MAVQPFSVTAPAPEWDWDLSEFDALDLWRPGLLWADHPPRRTGRCRSADRPCRQVSASAPGNAAVAESREPAEAAARASDPLLLYDGELE
jgi:hypothetical protein